MAHEDQWEKRRRAIEAGARSGGARGARAAEIAFNASARSRPLKLSSNMVVIPFKGGPINPTERGPIAAFTPPECPGCKKPLVAVDEIMYDSYAFNPETGRYDELPQRADCDMRCAACGYILPVDTFPEGVCNYDAEIDPCRSCGHAAHYPDNCEGCEALK